MSAYQDGHALLRIRSNLIGVGIAFMLTVFAPLSAMAMPETSGHIDEYNIPTLGQDIGGFFSSYSRSAISGPDGNVWFVEYMGGKVARVTTDGTITEYALEAGASPQYITVGSDGNMWVTMSGVNKIARVTPAGIITSFTLPGAVTDLGALIISGPDGNLWFDAGSGAIGRITTAGVSTLFTAAGSLTTLFSGPDGNVWFSRYNDSVSDQTIGYITPSGVVTTHPLSLGASPYGGVFAPDGSIWLVEMSGRVARVDPASGSASEFGAGAVGNAPNWIVNGPDGNIWFTNIFGNTVSRVTPAGVVTPYVMPDSVDLGGINTSGPELLAVGPDGNLWFVRDYANKITRITPTGIMTDFSVPSSVDVGVALVSGFSSLTVGSDGNLWFTALYTNKIGVLRFTEQSTPIDPPSEPEVPRAPATGLPQGGSIFPIGLGMSAILFTGLAATAGYRLYRANNR